MANEKWKDYSKKVFIFETQTQLYKVKRLKFDVLSWEKEKKIIKKNLFRLS